MKLEDKLYAYLPYELKIKWNDEDSKGTLTGISFIGDIIHAQLDFKGVKGMYEFSDFKPILRPLSDLTKEIEHEGITFNPYTYWSEKVVSKEQWQKICETISDDYCKIMDLPAWCVNLLYMWHFDIFNLIPEGLAIDINTIE